MTGFKCILSLKQKQRKLIPATRSVKWLWPSDISPALLQLALWLSVELLPGFPLPASTHLSLAFFSLSVLLVLGTYRKIRHVDKNKHFCSLNSVKYSSSLRGQRYFLNRRYQVVPSVYLWSGPEVLVFPKYKHRLFSHTTVYSVKYLLKRQNIQKHVLWWISKFPTLIIFRLCSHNSVFWSVSAFSDL